MAHYIRIGVSNKLLFSAKEGRALKQAHFCAREAKLTGSAHIAIHTRSIPLLHATPSRKHATEKRSTYPIARKAGLALSDL